MSNSTTGTPLTPQIDFTPVTGPFQYGLLMSWGLLGLLIHQVYIYNTRFARKDPVFFRVLVYAVLAIEIILVALLTHLVHALLVEGWGNPKVLLKLPWSGAMLALSTSTMALIVQLFFLWRLWKLNHDSRIIRVIVLLVVPIAFVHFACSIVLSNPGGYVAVIESRQKAQSIITVVAKMAFTGAFTCDILITTLMVISLARLRSRSRGIKTTSTKLNTLILRAVETGTITTVVALVALILYAHPALKTTAYYIAPHMALGRLYSTMLMVNLNGRGHFSGAQDGATPHSLHVEYGVELSHTSMRPHQTGIRDITDDMYRKSGLSMG